MLYFTADLHLGHDKIRGYCGRPFGTVQEMDAAILGNWNAVIRPDDTVYVVGDFCWGDPGPYLARLMGRVVLIRGNHDYERWLPAFGEVHDYLRLKDTPRKKRSIVLCHYPMRTWDGSHKGRAWMLHGHEHGRLPTLANSLDVGVDAHEYRPLSVEDVEKKITGTIEAILKRYSRDDLGREAAMAALGLAECEDLYDLLGRYGIPRSRKDKGAERRAAHPCVMDEDEED